MKFTASKPIPPLSVVDLIKSDNDTPSWIDEVGQESRIGYYSKQDGLDVIWLVNEQGKYEQSTDHDFLHKYFSIKSIADESDLYGEKRERIGPLN